MSDTASKNKIMTEQARFEAKLINESADPSTVTIELVVEVTDRGDIAQFAGMINKIARSTEAEVKKIITDNKVEPKTIKGKITGRQWKYGWEVEIDFTDPKFTRSVEEILAEIYAEEARS